jgi:hypothetical protein
MTWAERKNLVRQCRGETSNGTLSIQKWCAQRGISIKTFYNWKRHIDREDIKEPAVKSATGKREWAILPADNEKKDNEGVSESEYAIYQISYDGFTVKLTNELSSKALTEILKAVKLTCC